jgi:PTH1 family peptidyl-tRNA hydrolase
MDELSSHVLSRFKPSERPVIDEARMLALQAVSVWLQQGIEACMNRFNADSVKEPDGKKS